MAGRRDWRARARARAFACRRHGRFLDLARADGGFTLLETIVALAVLCTVLSAVSMFFVQSTVVTNQQRLRQTAVSLTKDAMEGVRALPPSAIVVGRDRASVDNQVRVRGVGVYLADAEPAYDLQAAAGTGADAAVPTDGTVTTSGGIAFTRYWYVVKCWQASWTASAGGVCDLANKNQTPHAEFLRVVIAVSWPGRECFSGTCVFVTSTLISGRDDPLFGAGPPPPPDPASPPDDAVLMGGSCNAFGDDPDPTAATVRSPACAGGFWANIDAPASAKHIGDPYQTVGCKNPNVERCTGTADPAIENVDFDPEGYVYTVRVTTPLPSLTIEAFDPAAIGSGDKCPRKGFMDDATGVTNKYVTNPAQRYALDPGPYCVGDNSDGGTPMITQFAVRSVGSASGGPASSHPLETRCAEAQPQKFTGYNGPAQLSTVLSNPTAGSTYDYVAKVFRRWVPLCTISTPVLPGEYLIQITSYGVGTNGANSQNGFALRAFAPGWPAHLNDAISLSGRGRMGVTAIRTGVTAEWFLARVPSSAAGRTLTVNVWDLGDADEPGTVRVVPPADASTGLTNCVGTGPATGTLADCSFTFGRNFDGRWQTLRIPIPANYTCADTNAAGLPNPAGCWLRLRLSYPAGTNDTSGWEAFMGAT